MARRVPNALLLVDSIDRYSKPKPDTPSYFVDTYLETKFNDGVPAPFQPTQYGNYRNTYPGNKFTIFANQPMIYGAIDTISVSQIQMYYAVPTITPFNNRFWICNVTSAENIPDDPDQATAEIIIPVGFYTPVELCAMLQYLINATNLFVNPDGSFQFTCRPVQDQFAANPGSLNGTYQQIYWRAETNDNPSEPIDWFFCSPEEVLNNGVGPQQPWHVAKQQVLRTFETLGITKYACGWVSEIPGGFPNVNSNPASIKQTQPFKILYTPYVDILSNNLTKYQDVKDSDTKPNKQANFIARVYLNGQGSPQLSLNTNAPGSRPFYVLATLNNTKVIQWSPEEAVYNLDFELRDAFGELLYWDSEVAPTEFQITLMCSE
jgi:hypothetical protein